MNGELCKTCGWQEADHGEHPDCKCGQFVPPAAVYRKGWKCQCGKRVRIMQEQWMDGRDPQTFLFVSRHFLKPDKSHFGTNWNKPVLCPKSLTRWHEPESDDAPISHSVFAMTPQGIIDIGS